jgi:hypothetical protein
LGKTLGQRETCKKSQGWLQDNAWKEKKVTYRNGGEIMATAKQKRAARRNIKKAQRKWKRMSKRARARAMPGRSRRR